MVLFGCSTRPLSKLPLRPVPRYIQLWWVSNFRKSLLLPNSPPLSVCIYVTGMPCFRRIWISHVIVAKGGPLWWVGNVKAKLVVIQTMERREVWILYSKRNSPYKEILLFGDSIWLVLLYCIWWKSVICVGNPVISFSFFIRTICFIDLWSNCWWVSWLLMPPVYIVETVGVVFMLFEKCMIGSAIKSMLLCGTVGSFTFIFWIGCINDKCWKSVCAGLRHLLYICRHCGDTVPVVALGQ